MQHKFDWTPTLMSMIHNMQIKDNQVIVDNNQLFFYKTSTINQIFIIDNSHGLILTNYINILPSKDPYHHCEYCNKPNHCKNLCERCKNYLTINYKHIMRDNIVHINDVKYYVDQTLLQQDETEQEIGRTDKISI